MPTTSNFGWTTPADTDLVKDGAAAIRTLGNGIDTSFLDLKGGTTGQVLSKASNTDLDFTWSSVDPLTILDAKGDLISATAADTPARLAVGTNGQVLTADSTTSTGLKWATPGGYSWTSAASGSFPTNNSEVTISALSGKSYIIIASAVTFGSADLIRIRFNNDGNNNYYRVDGTAASAVDGSNATFTAAREFAWFVPQASGTAALKMCMPVGTGTGTTLVGASWKSTSDITSIKFFSQNGGNFSGGTYQIWSVQ